MTSTTTPPRTRRRRLRTTADWTPEFAALVDRRTCTHGTTPRLCGICKSVARHLATLTGVREYRR